MFGEPIHIYYSETLKQNIRDGVQRSGDYFGLVSYGTFK